MLLDLLLFFFFLLLSSSSSSSFIEYYIGTKLVTLTGKKKKNHK